MWVSLSRFWHQHMVHHNTFYILCTLASMLHTKMIFTLLLNTLQCRHVGNRAKDNFALQAKHMGKQVWDWLRMSNLTEILFSLDIREPLESWLTPQCFAKCLDINCLIWFFFSFSLSFSSTFQKDPDLVGLPWWNIMSFFSVRERRLNELIPLFCGFFFYLFSLDYKVKIDIGNPNLWI